MLETVEEFKRKPIELNLAAAKKRKSAQTGFIHYYPFSLPLEPHDTIPLYENFCYALALLRSRLSDHVLEAKSLLEKLIAFEAGGNLPVYLHEYPHCHDRCTVLHILPVLFWILHHFSDRVLGESLTLQLKDLTNRALLHAERSDREKPLPLAAWAKWKAYAAPQQILGLTFETPTEWADYLIALQIAQAQGVEVKSEVERVYSRWNPHHHLLIGPHHQEKSEPEVTLFDLFMGYAQQKFSKRALSDRSIHLRAALIQPFLLNLPPALESVSYCHHTTDDPRQGYIRSWGDEMMTHTLSCDHRGSALKAFLTEETAQLQFELKDGWEPSEQAEVPLSFFCNLTEAHTLLINGKKATTFQLGDRIEVVTGSERMEIQFSRLAGEGTFFGHLMRANRPTQKSNVGIQRFEAYDWLLAVRTVRRSNTCTLFVEIKKLPLN